MSRNLSFGLTAFAAAAWLAATPSQAHAQKALVYCPVGVDAAGCNAIVAALTADASLFPGGVDAGYDGTSGTVDLATAELPPYAVLVVPSLADGQGVTPYALLRDATIAGRIRGAFMGRTAVWSGTPDVGSTNRAAKDALIRNLAGWAKADAAGTHGPGLVVLQDNSDDAAGRYGWIPGISALAVAPDTTLDVYSNVQVLTTTGRTILTNSSGLQIGYTNMASYGLVPPSGTNADATGGRSSRVVLMTAAGEPSDPNIATVRTDKEDYQPGDTVSVTGTGWQPGETVSLLFHEDVDPAVHPDKTFTAVADAEGRIFNHEYEIDELDLDIRFTLQAAGESSGNTAQTTFTDAVNFQSVSVGTQTPSSVIPGASATFTVTVGFGGNNTPTCSVALTLTTALPTGATSSFSPSSVASPGGANQTSTLTISTTAATTTGSVSFNVRGVGTGCTGTQNGTGTLVVKRPSTTAVTGPPSSTFGQSVTFTATVTGSGATPSGTVQFKDGGVNLGVAQTLSAGGSATLSTSTLAVGGSHSITADYGGDANFTSSTSSALTHTVSKADQTITFTSSAPVGAVVGGAIYTATATGGASGNVVTFTSVTTGVCTSSGTNGATISFVAVGTCTVAANQVGNTNYNAAAQVTQGFTVGKGNQTITFTSTAPTNATVGGPVYTVAATGGASGNSVQFSISSLATGVCTSSGTNGATITMVTAGTCTVAADQAGNGNYNAATQASQSFTIGKASQTISFDLSTLPAKTFGDADFSVASFAHASSGLTVTFASGSPTRCTVSSAGVVHISTASGNCMVTASQGGDANFSAAADVSQTFNVAKAGQTITFTSTAPAAALVGGPTYTAVATASSGLVPVTFSSLTVGVCTSTGTNGATITFVGGGTCSVAANQAGNGDYNAAPQVTQSFSVSAKASQTISFTSTAPASAVFGGSYAVAATATSGLAVVFSSLTLPVCTVAASTVTFVGVGTCTVAANQPGNASFLAALQVTQGFEIGQGGQTISFAALADKAYGDANFTVTATASSGLTVSFAASGTCTVSGASVHLTGNGSCTITASQPGNTNYTAAADVPQSFTIGKASVTPHITVQPKPYDGATTATIVSRSLTGVVSPDVVSLEGGTAAFDAKDAGADRTVTGSGFTLSGADAGKYQLDPATATTTANITPRQITVTASTDSREYDGTRTSSATPAITLGDLVTGDVGAFTQTYDTKHVGTGKTLTPTGAVTDGNSGHNYDVTFKNVATGVITTRALTVSATGTPKQYDGTTTATVTLSDDRVTGDELTLSYTGAAFADKHAGTAKTINVTGISVGGSDAGNYTFNTTATGTANITARPITVTAATDSRIYDGTTNSAGLPSVTTGTLVAGDTPNFTQSYDTKHVGTGKTLTPVGSVNDGNSGNDYDVTLAANTTGVIKVRPMTVTAAADSKTYDRTTSSTGTPSVTSGSLALGDAGAFTQTYDTRNVGTAKTLTPAGAVNDGNSGNNYGVTFEESHAGVILAKPLTGTITAQGKQYDGTTDATIATRSLSGVIDPDAVSYEGGTGTFDTRNAGTDKTVTATGLSLSGADAGNYSVNTTATAAASISRRPITVKAVADNRIYNGTTSSAGVPEITEGNLVGGDTKGFSQSFDTKSVGSGKTLTPTGAVIDGNSGGNYDVTFVSSQTGQITARALTVTATGIPKVYDGTRSATVTLSDDRITGDVLSLSYGSASFADKNVGTAKPVSVTGITVTGTDVGNYTFNTTASATANITHLALAVTAAATNKYYDGNTTASATLSATPLSGDVVTLSFASANFDNPNVGTSKTVTVSGITLGGADGGNYDPNPPTHTAATTASILPWTLAGFYQPVDMPTGGMILNSIKGGQTVPLKFEIFVGGVERTDVAAVKSFGQAQVTCPSTPLMDDIEVVSTGGTVLRYDATGGQYIQNWQTPKAAGQCFRVTMTTQDNSSIVAYFKTK